MGVKGHWLQGQMDRSSKPTNKVTLGKSFHVSVLWVTPS